MTTLYKLNEQYQELLNKILYENVENEEDLIEELAKIEIEVEDKAENTAIVIKELEAEINKIEEEEKRLSNRKKSLKNNVKFLKSNLGYSMKLQDKKKFKTEHFSFNIQKNAPSVMITDEEKALKNYKKVTETIDKAKLKDPVLIYVKLLEFMEKEKIDPREMAIGCKIYESIYNEQSKYFNLENF